MMRVKELTTRTVQRIQAIENEYREFRLSVRNAMRHRYGPSTMVLSDILDELNMDEPNMDEVDQYMRAHGHHISKDAGYRRPLKFRGPR